MLFLRDFILKPTERTQVLLNNGTSGFWNNPSFERSACFYVTFPENFERTQHFLILEKIFWKTETPFKKLECCFYLKVLRLKTQHFHTKLLCQKPILRQIEWGVRNVSTTKNRNLPVTTWFFWKFCFSLRTLYKELIWYPNHGNAHIHILEKYSRQCEIFF